MNYQQTNSESDPVIPGGYYIKARRFKESLISTAPPHIREIWDWLLREANHRIGVSHGRAIQRGEQVRSYKDIQEGLCWYVGYRKEKYSKSQCNSAMKWLVKYNMITKKKTTRGLHIKITNYDYYQDPKNYESHNRTTTKPQSTATINKNRKNDKNRKNKVDEGY
jgi:hypothetical protein